MNVAIHIILSVLLLEACGSGSTPRHSGGPADSAQFVQRAQAALDSNRGGPSTIPLAVREFRREGQVLVIVLGPISAAVRGGGGIVRLDSTGRVLFVRGFQ
jgi:hypothetical protein